MSLGVGGLIQNHPNGTGALSYTDPASGVVIDFPKAPQTTYTSVGRSRGWSNDTNAEVLGAGYPGDHLALAMFSGPGTSDNDRVTLDFSAATGILPSSTVTINIYDLDQPSGKETEQLVVHFDGVEIAGSPFSNNVNIFNPVALDAPTNSFTFTAGSVNLVKLTALNDAAGYIAFNIDYTAVPEPSSALLLFSSIGCLLFRRRR